MSNLIKIKTTWRHTTLEYHIKQHDSSQDMSRAAVFEREVKAAEGIKNWKKKQELLAPYNLIQDEDAPIFTSFQVKCSDETAEKLEQIREDILTQLKGEGMKSLHNPYLVLLLQANYLDVLKQEKLKMEAEDKIEETNIDMPEMAKILCEMMLKDKECEQLKQIQKLLIDWREK